MAARRATGARARGLWRAALPVAGLALLVAALAMAKLGLLPSGAALLVGLVGAALLALVRTGADRAEPAAPDDAPRRVARAALPGTSDESETAAPLAIGDAIDLHGFAPRDVVSVVESYLEAAHERGLREVRLIHGRGKGVQRARVQSLLARHPLVERFADAPPSRGGWGATIAWLAARDDPRSRR